jgi:hypothetical protein
MPFRSASRVACPLIDQLLHLVIRKPPAKCRKTLKNMLAGKKAENKNRAEGAAIVLINIRIRLFSYRSPH